MERRQFLFLRGIVATAAVVAIPGRSSSGDGRSEIRVRAAYRPRAGLRTIAEHGPGTMRGRREGAPDRSASEGYFLLASFIALQASATVCVASAFLSSTLLRASPKGPQKLLNSAR